MEIRDRRKGGNKRGGRMWRKENTIMIRHCATSGDGEGVCRGVRYPLSVTNPATHSASSILVSSLAVVQGGGLAFQFRFFSFRLLCRFAFISVGLRPRPPLFACLFASLSSPSKRRFAGASCICRCNFAMNHSIPFSTLTCHLPRSLAFVFHLPSAASPSIPNESRSFSRQCIRSRSCPPLYPFPPSSVPTMMRFGNRSSLMHMTNLTKS